MLLQLKRKAREAGDTEAGVTLATGHNDSAEGSDDQREEEAWMGQHDQDNDGDGGLAYEGGLTSSDEDERDEELQQAVSSKAGQAAYFGMQTKKGSESAAAKEYEGLSLAEQEALALKMIKK